MGHESNTTRWCNMRIWFGIFLAVLAAFMLGPWTFIGIGIMLIVYTLWLDDFLRETFYDQETCYDEL